MAKHGLRLDGADLTALQDAAADVIAAQPFIQRRKNTIASVANLVLQALNVIAVAVTGYDPRIAVVVGVLIFLAEILVHACTTGPLTPSGAQKLIAEAQDRRNDNIVPAVYSGASTADIAP